MIARQNFLRGVEVAGDKCFFSGWKKRKRSKTSEGIQSKWLLAVKIHIVNAGEN